MPCDPTISFWTNTWSPQRGHHLDWCWRCSKMVLSFFCFFIMSFFIQVSVTKRSRHRIGQNKILHIVLTTHIFQIVACGHVQPLFLQSFVLGLIDKKLKETIKHTKYSYAAYKHTCLFKHFILILIYLFSQAASRYGSFVTRSKTICSLF